MSIFSNANILITGGTGSFGKEFVKKTLEKYPDIKRLVIFSRDELKQWEMQNQFPIEKYPQLRFFLGDIRDKSRLVTALNQVDIVVHAAALKQVPAAEYNPIEFIKTNVIGSENIVQACLETNVQKCIALSTDKAAAPVNLYGATKLCADKLFIAANNIIGSKDLKFAVVRYGNVMGSRGSVIPFFLKKAKEGIIPITNNEMTRFNILLSEGVEMVHWAIENSIGSEIFVPKIPSYRITDVAEAIGPSCEKVIVGIRPGEKIHEEMITHSDSSTTLDLGHCFAILPTSGNSRLIYERQFNYVEEGFSYNSLKNKHFLNVGELRDLIRLNIVKNFKPL